MGVTATGKTTLGEALARATGGAFYDGDDYHPKENIIKMASGLPLDDGDRQGWLAELSTLVARRAAMPAPTFIACSALKESYREILRAGYPELAFLLLVAPRAVLLQRITARFESGGHFMPPSLLDSQFATLEVPDYSLEMDVTRPVSELVALFESRFPTT